MLHKNRLTITLNKHNIDTRIALVVSLYNRGLTESLEKKCVETLASYGIKKDNINVFYVEGAFEIPLACQRIAKQKKYNILIALGVIIKGDTYHFELVAEECAAGIMEVMLKYNIPIVFEVLAGNREDMERRAKDDLYNKGIEAADTVLRLLEFNCLLDNNCGKLIERTAKAHLPTKFGMFVMYVYKENLSSKEHIALVMGRIKRDKPVLTRVHSRCLTGDVFQSLRCDCNRQLSKALELISVRGDGVLVYLNQEGRGIGLTDKIQSYALQDQGYDTVEANIKLGYKADMRTYHVGAQILRDLGVRKMELLTNNPYKISGIEQYGLKIVKRVPIVIPEDDYNKKYLSTKRDKMGHLLH